MSHSPKNEAAARRNRIGLIVCAAALALAVILLSLPMFELSASVYTKRSPNTFVGDEKYAAALAEAEAVAAGYPGASIEEAVTERVNSKGETTSLVVFSVMQSVRANAWRMLTALSGTGIAFWAMLVIMLGCAVLAALLAAAGMRGYMAMEHRSLAPAPRALRTAACWLGLIALLCVPVLGMTFNYNFSRQIKLMTGGFEIGNVSGVRLALESLFFGGGTGDTDALLGALRIHTLWPLWALFPVLFAFLLGLILLRNGELKPALARGALYAAVIVLCVLILYPFYVMLITGFRSNAEATDMHFLHMMPTEWIWSNLPAIIDRGVLRFLGNSILLSAGATLIAMLCGIPAAYAMARMNFKGKKAFLGFVIMSQMFAPVVLLVGISQLMINIHLNDTIWGLMLINAAFNQAFAIWLLRGTFVSISSEMEQAACIDGCNTVSALIRILLPMAAPGIVTTLIFVFINAWNEYTISTVLISTPANKPITVGITQFSSFNMIEWNYLFASALLATIPVVILFMCIEKHLVSGLTSGGVKG